MTNSESIPLKETVGPLLHELLSELQFQSCPQVFAYPDSVRTESILFIGLNPSNINKDHDGIETYELLQDDAEHPHFLKLQEISEYCGIPWTYLDLLFFRESDHGKIQNLLETDIGCDFVWRQLQVSDRIIRDIDAKVMVVGDALAQTLLGFEEDGKKNRWMGYEFVFDKEIDAYRWKGIPVFFMEMLKEKQSPEMDSFDTLKDRVKYAVTFHLKK